MRILIPVLGFALTACSTATPETPPGEHEEHAAAANASPSAKAFEAASAKMHKDMAVVLTGDADTDFMRTMIPHHEGAVAMARIVLTNGKDPEVRKLAQSVISTQEQEILVMRDWLVRREKSETDTQTKRGK